MGGHDMSEPPSVANGRRIEAKGSRTSRPNDRFADLQLTVVWIGW